MSNETVLSFQDNVVFIPVENTNGINIFFFYVEHEFENTKGKSNMSFVVVTDLNAANPTISSVTPASGFEGATVVLTGTNFSKEWNDIYVGNGFIKGIVSPDGVTLSFPVSLPIPGLASGQDVAGVDSKIPLWIYVVNPNGVTERDAGTVFTLNI